MPVKKCTEWLKYSRYVKPKFDDSYIIESKCIISNCENYSILKEVAISSLLNILDIIPLLKQVIIKKNLNYIFFTFNIIL